MSDPHHVVVIGGGFGGLYCARKLGNKRGVRVTLIDKRNFHLFQPLLYQVATAGLSPGNIAAPLREIVKRQKNVTVLMAEVTGIDPSRKTVVMRDGELGYDTLVVATGSRHNYFGNDQWEQHAPGLKTIEDATHIRRRIFLAFETAERLTDPARRVPWLTFVVVGAGATGVEMAGAVCEIARHTLRGNFRSINPADARVYLIEGSGRVLPPYPEPLSARAKRDLERLGVTLRLDTLVTDVRDDGVTLRHGDTTEELPTHTVIWSAGVQASGLGRVLAEYGGAECDRAGCVKVTDRLTIGEQHPDIFVIGDLAHCLNRKGERLPGLAPVAMQQGRYVADTVRRRLAARPVKPFRYKDRGSMATIGRSTAVADLGWIHLKGFPGWSAWLFVHLMFLIQFHNRMLVLMQWAWNYITWGRSTRLITGDDPGPLRPPDDIGPDTRRHLAPDADAG